VSQTTEVRAARVLRLAELDCVTIAQLLARYGLTLRLIPPSQSIPGSYWGDSEAGLQRDTLFARPDTPLHSVLHEACHYICMDATRRAGLDRDAGGDDPEECGVCYLQLLLADELPQSGLRRALSDMDDWGYSFRLGSAQAWFESDAGDARLWLLHHGLIGADGRPSFTLRE
jgi:hypothetical protein